ncbi:hypothetical protein ABS71_00720 [bacterium SCN 62-11]|nr:MAG: hypothetical protein ABS71_00720 [bacterium SCN 62-11]
MTSLGFTTTFSSDFDFSSYAALDYSSYTSIFIAWTANSSLIVSQSANLNNWVFSGGSLFLESPNFDDAQLAAMPGGVGLSQSGGGGDDVVVTTPGIYTAGLTDADFSAWSNSYHNTFNATGSLTTILSNTSSNALALAGSFGSGSVVFSQLDPSYHIQNGSGPTGPTSSKGLFIQAGLLAAYSEDAPELSTSGAPLGLAIALLPLLAFSSRRKPQPV